MWHMHLLQFHQVFLNDRLEDDVVCLRDDDHLFWQDLCFADANNIQQTPILVG